MGLRVHLMQICIILLLLAGLLAPAGETVPVATAEPPAVGTAAAVPAEPSAEPLDPAFFHDFGKVIEGVRPSYTFTFTNTTAKPLNILSIRIPCGCAQTSIGKKDLAPGEGTAFTISFNSKGRLGRVTKPMYVLTDAPDLAMVKYTVQAVVEPKPSPRCVVPGTLQLGSLTVNQVVEAVLWVENRGTLDLDITPGVKPRNLVLAGAFPLVVKPGEKAELKLAYTAAFHKGRQRDNLQLKTNDPLRPEVWVVIQAETAAAKTKTPVPPSP
jgi:hypothetical protein